MKFDVSKGAQMLGILKPSICILGPFSPQVFSSELSKTDYARVEGVLANHCDLLNSEPAKAYRQIFERMGYASQTPAGERLIRSFAEKGFKRYNALIDACNIASIESASGLGLHDRESLVGNLYLGVATGEETILPLFKDKPLVLNPGDLYYSDASNVVAWLGKKDVDSDLHKVTSSTRSVILIALGNAISTFAETASICRRFHKILQNAGIVVPIQFAEVYLE